MHSPKVVIANWTGNQNHFGCRLVSSAYCRLLDDHQFKLIDVIPCGRDWRDHNDSLKRADIVIVNGEGSLHHNRHRPLLDIPLEHRAVLLNTVWDSMDPHPGLEHFYSIWCRETLSQRALEASLAKATRPPKVRSFGDLALSAPELAAWEGGRTSAAVVTDAVNKRGPKIPNCPLEALRFLSGESVHTGRFHAGIACASMGVPVSLFPSNSHKNQGLAIDAGLVCNEGAPEYRVANRHWLVMSRMLQRQAFATLRQVCGL